MCVCTTCRAGASACATACMPLAYDRPHVLQPPLRARMHGFDIHTLRWLQVLDSAGNWNNVLQVVPQPPVLTSREGLALARWQAARHALSNKLGLPEA